jgi:catechol 2,3-dioxygenase-like lactoylglutathione lyase family enzyme
MGLDSVQVTTVWVSDVERALEFYTRALDLEKRTDASFGDGGRFLTVAPPGESTEIALQPAEEGRVGVATGIVFGSDDPWAAAEELKRRGVEFTEEPAEQEWGAVMGQFVDPDGNGFVLHSRRGA